MTVDSISTYLNNKGAHNIYNKSTIETLKQLQGNGLINPLYRPIDITSKAPNSTPSQSVASPFAENHVNDANDTIGNSSLNVKSESLKSKLCGDVMIMKSYFIDELWSLRNEATINKKQDCNINIEETTTLKKSKTVGT